MDSLLSVSTSESGAVIRVQPSVELLPVELEGRQVGVLSAESPGSRDEWEMHPEQDELLYLLEGEIDVFLSPDPEGSQEETRHFRQGEACLIPKGMWHRQVVVVPCKVLFLTPETIHQPYTPESGWDSP
jgi:mannose-6-phosphate isomerase-like protein (cupin superfamily)